MTNLQPLNDRVLIRRLEDPQQRIGSIIVPDIAKSRAIKGEIVAVGRGKWHPGEFWWVKHYDIRTDSIVKRWEWQEGWLEPPPLGVYPGITVYFNSKWSDVGADYQTPGVGWDESLHMVQIADIFAIAN